MIASRTLADWEAVLGEVDCCFERVHEIDEMLAHPQIKQRRMVVRHDGPDPFIEVLFPAWIDGEAPRGRAPVRMTSAAEIIKAWGAEAA